MPDSSQPNPPPGPDPDPMMPSDSGVADAADKTDHGADHSDPVLDAADLHDEKAAGRRGFAWALWDGLTWFPRKIGRNARQIWNDNKVVLVIVGFFFAFVVAFFWQSIFIKIGPGDGGVLYRLFFGGTVTDKVYGEGLHYLFPWDTMYIYNARVQQVSDEFTVLSQDGLAIKIEVSIRFRPMFDQLGLLHKNLGPDYVDKVVIPEVQSEFRFLLGQYKPDQIYNSQGFILQNVVQGSLGQLAERYILLDNVLLKAVTLPPPVAASIESKLRAQQLFEEYTYRNQSEDMEAKRKQIEANGIKAFQDTVMLNKGEFDQYLRFKGIDATLELAKSPNSKIVIIGGGEDRLPLILDGTDKNSTPVEPRSEPAAAPRPSVSAGARH